jgi:hypothetical protein
LGVRGFPLVVPHPSQLGWSVEKAPAGGNFNKTRHRTAFVSSAALSISLPFSLLLRAAAVDQRLRLRGAPEERGGAAAAGSGRSALRPQRSGVRSPCDCAPPPLPRPLTVRSSATSRERFQRNLLRRGDGVHGAGHPVGARGKELAHIAHVLTSQDVVSLRRRRFKMRVDDGH